MFLFILLKKLNKKDGYIVGMTLVELLVALSIFIVVMVAISAVGSNIFIYNSNISGSFTASQNSQAMLKTILKELREITPGANGAYPLVYVGSTTLSFFSDANNNGLPEKITYTLIGQTLYRAKIEPTGNPLVYLSSNQSTTTLVTNIINGSSVPLFQYFDNSYTGTSSPLSYPVNPSSVRLIKVNQKIDIDPNRSPIPIIFSIQVSLRNLKTNL